MARRLEIGLVAIVLGCVAVASWTVADESRGVRPVEGMRVGADERRDAPAPVEMRNACGDLPAVRIASGFLVIEDAGGKRYLMAIGDGNATITRIDAETQTRTSDVLPPIPSRSLPIPMDEEDIPPNTPIASPRSAPRPL